MIAAKKSFSSDRVLPNASAASVASSQEHTGPSSVAAATSKTPSSQNAGAKAMACSQDVLNQFEAENRILKRELDTIEKRIEALKQGCDLDESDAMVQQQAAWDVEVDVMQQQLHAMQQQLVGRDAKYNAIAQQLDTLRDAKFNAIAQQLVVWDAVRQRQQSRQVLPIAPPLLFVAPVGDLNFTVPLSTQSIAEPRPSETPSSSAAVSANQNLLQPRHRNRWVNWRPHTQGDAGTCVLSDERFRGKP